MKEAAVWSLIWVVVSVVFVGWLWWYLGGASGEPVANQKSLEFITGYLVEKALVVDNIFVFLMIFTDVPGTPLDLTKDRIRWDLFTPPQP